MYTLLVVYALMTGGLMAQSDCGESSYVNLISKTKSLIEKKGELIIPITEIPSGLGRKECVRLEFYISKYGKAVDVIEGDSSGDYIMNVAGVRALSGYKFRYIKNNANIRYTLIFSGVIGAAPAYEGK